MSTPTKKRSSDADSSEPSAKKPKSSKKPKEPKDSDDTKSEPKPKKAIRRWHGDDPLAYLNLRAFWKQVELRRDNIAEHTETIAKAVSEGNPAPEDAVLAKQSNEAALKKLEERYKSVMDFFTTMTSALPHVVSVVPEMSKYLLQSFLQTEHEADK